MIVDCKGTIRTSDLEKQFIRICDELAQKLPEKAEHFCALKRECRERMFDLPPNMDYLLWTYGHMLDTTTVVVSDDK